MKTKIDHPFYLQIQNEIDRIDFKADKYRIAFYCMRIGLILIAGIITVISGLKGIDDEECVLNLVLILGAVITALTSMDTLFQIETKKNIYKLMLVELREIRTEIAYYYNNKEAELKAKIESHLYPKYQAVMAYSKTLIEKIEKEDTNKDNQV